MHFSRWSLTNNAYIEANNWYCSFNWLDMTSQVTLSAVWTLSVVGHLFSRSGACQLLWPVFMHSTNWTKFGNQTDFGPESHHRLVEFFSLPHWKSIIMIVLRAILKLSLYSPIAPLYFLLGELPIEATLHLDVLNLFWNIWSNPHTMTFKVLQYLLIMAKDNSATWAAHIRLIFQLYSLSCPITL